MQTRLAKEVSGYLKKNHALDVKIEKVDIDFFSKVNLEEVLVRDHHEDSLLYLSNLAIAIQYIDFTDLKVVVNKMQLENPKIKIIHYKDEEVDNLTRVVNEFSSDTLATETTEALDLKLIAKKIQLLDGQLFIDNQNDSIVATNIDPLFVEMSKLNYHKDSVSVRMDQMNFCQEAGFCMGNMTFDFRMLADEISLKNWGIYTANSSFDADVKVMFSSMDDFSTPELLNFDIDIRELDVNTRDMIYFNPNLKVKETIQMKGGFTGSLKKLKAKDMDLSFGSGSYFFGNATFKDVLDTDHIFMDLDVAKMGLLKRDIKRFASYGTDEFPEMLNTIGDIRFKGKFRGYFDEFFADGKIDTDIGEVDANLFFTYKDVQIEKAEYNGSLDLKDFNVGALLENELVGEVSLGIELRGKGIDLEHIDAYLDGEINALDFNGYNYHNVLIGGRLATKKFAGSLEVDDKNLEFDFNGNIDLAGAKPIFDFTLDVPFADLFELHVVNADSIAHLSTNIKINLAGDHIDNIDGELVVTYTTYETSENYYFFNDFRLNAQNVDSLRYISLDSDMMKGKLTGEMKMAELMPALQNTLGRYFSAVDKQGVFAQQDFDVDVEIFNTRPLTEIFMPELTLETGGSIVGRYKSNENDLTLDFKSPGIRYGDMEIKDIRVESYTGDEAIELDFHSSAFYYSETGKIDSISYVSLLRSDTAFFELDWLAGDSLYFNGNLGGYASQNSDEAVVIGLRDSQVDFTGDVWKFNEENQIVYDSTGVYIDHLEVQSAAQEIAMNGKISELESDQINVKLKKIEMLPFEPFLRGANTKLDGKISGELNVGQAMKDPYFISNIKIDSLSLNDDFIGVIDLESEWDPDKKEVFLGGMMHRGTRKYVVFDAYYWPYNKEDPFEINMHLDGLKFRYLNRYVKAFMSDLNGLLSGDVSITHGSLQGEVTLEKAAFTIPYLGTRYNVEGVQHIFFDPDKIRFPEFNFRGQKSKRETTRLRLDHGSGFMSGELRHNNFSNMYTDLYISLESLICLDTNIEENELYYGTAYVSGEMDIFGYADDLKINAAARTEEDTDIIVPISDATEIEENSFVEFISKGETFEDERDDAYEVDLGGLDMDFRLEVTPEAMFTMEIDESVLKARGSSRIDLKIDAVNGFTITGDYEVDQAEYLFALQGLIKKPFVIEKGGTVKWTGDPFGARVDLAASYGVKTSLSRLDQLEVDTKTVKCLMKIEDNIMQPTIYFDIALPNDASEAAKSQMLELTNSDDKRSKQFLALLTMNNFFIEDNNNGVVAATGVTTGIELLTSQLNSWLSQASDRFDLQVVIVPGDPNNDLDNEEVELILDKFRINDRVNVNGKVGAPVSETSSEIVGDFVIEYKIKKDGDVLLKAFTRSNQNQFDPTAIDYTQGVGFFYKEDFDSFSELFNRLKSKFKKDDDQEEDDTGKPIEKKRRKRKDTQG